MEQRWMNVTTPNYETCDYPAGLLMGPCDVTTRDSVDVLACTKTEARKLAYRQLARIRHGYVETRRSDNLCPFTGWEVYVYTDEEAEWIADGAV